MENNLILVIIVYSLLRLFSKKQTKLRKCYTKEEADAIVPKIISDLVDQINRHGFDALGMPQKLFWAVLDYEGEVCNGGHSQYFFNSIGNNWKFALQGLKSMGATTRRAILKDALVLFGPEGPPTDDPDEREQTMFEFSRLEGEQLETCDQRYYAHIKNVTNNLYILLLHYAVRHPSYFKIR